MPVDMSTMPAATQSGVAEAVDKFENLRRALAASYGRSSVQVRAVDRLLAHLRRSPDTGDATRQ